MNKIDLTGQRFGHLIVIERAEDYISPSGIPTPKWRCKCDCGNYKAIREDSLKSGLSQSCGCRNYKQNTGKAHKIYIGEDIRWNLLK